MTKLYFEELMGEFGCHCVDDIAFGTHNAYPYTAEMQSHGAPLLLVFHFVLDKPASPALLALKRENIPHIRWHESTDETGHALVGTLRPPSDFYAKAEIHGLLGAACAALEKAELATPDTCPLCALSGCDTYAFLNEGYRATHDACLQNRLELLDADVKPDETIRGHYATGILGALLGAGIALLPNWAQALSNGRINSVLYVLIPFLSTLLYRLFRGKASRNFSAIVVLLSSLSAAFVLELFWYWLAVSDSFSISITFSQSVYSYFQTHTFSSTIKEMLFSLVFLLVGYFASTVLLRRYAKGGTVHKRAVRGSTFVRASARPIHPETQQAQNSLPKGGTQNELI